jgi:hypothetical protein
MLLAAWVPGGGVAYWLRGRGRFGICSSDDRFGLFRVLRNEAILGGSNHCF